MKCFRCEEPATAVPRVSARGRLGTRGWVIRTDCAACDTHVAEARAALEAQYGEQVVVIQFVAPHVARWQLRRAPFNPGRVISDERLAQDVEGVKRRREEAGRQEQLEDERE